MIRYGAPLVWGVFMLQMIDASGRYFLGHYSTLEQVGLMIGVTKERVRQIQNRALQKIRIALEESYLVA